MMSMQTSKNRKRAIFMDENALDLPYYKGIQLPRHLKWITVQSKVSESQLIQEIHALDLEVKRLKRVKAIHKELRRYVDMPSK